jgi:hypothetical protein
LQALDVYVSIILVKNALSLNKKYMEESTMKKHVTLVAALQIGFSTLGLLGSVIMYFVFSFAGSFVTDVEEATVVLKFLGSFIPSLVAIFSLLGLLGGIGLLNYRHWARTLVLVIAAINCLFFPIGTIVGVYSLWVLMQDDSIQLFK